MIRRYESRDRDELLEVWFRASRIAHPFLDARFLAAERQRIAETFLPRAETWVYFSQDRLAGFISLLETEVGGLFVDPAAQGRGIGRALMNHARSLRDCLEVSVFAANRIGRRFYERYGFEPVGKGTDELTGHPILRLRLGDRHDGPAAAD